MIHGTEESFRLSPEHEWTGHIHVQIKVGIVSWKTLTVHGR